ncbi:hypothetical protein KGF56_002274 [Candida oxycetoniae]|uniref:Uncharacterized protein n=1 Tax=Candida oxycetoniae TaxID=497107 RepID=A0AAI9SYP2_9ASCO|nr:uncharacterized protein KGF56_002274 [Candida oxycetoniae]KAI3404945.1 hypothetical protein KGF56_002274 [Candida oxycetoniae]
MGLLTIIKKQKQKDKEIRVLALGLDNAGKTTIIKRMLKLDVESVSPTMGFQINTVPYMGHLLNIWDIGGQTTLRAFWGNYFDKTEIVIWVIDGLSMERLNESFLELKEKIILQDRLVGIYLLVAINKVDLVPQEELPLLKQNVAKILKLDEYLPDENHWHIELVSGKTGIGIENVLNWIVSRDY